MAKRNKQVSISNKAILAAVVIVALICVGVLSFITGLTVSGQQTKTIVLKDSTGKSLAADVRVQIGNSTYDIQNLPAEAANDTIGVVNVSIEPKESPVKKIEILDITTDQARNLDIGIDDVPDEKGLSGAVEVYAIDPTRSNFTSATVTAIAKGNELWKCKDWNFTEQTCYGEWIKLMDITPGQEYSFELTPEDPGFGEIIQDAGKVWDSYISENSGNSNYGTSTMISIDDKNSQRKRSLLNFNISIPRNAVINSAVLKLYEFSSIGSAINVTVYRVTRNWTETGVTWNKYDGTNTWATAGGDFNESYGTVLVATTSDAWVSWNVTNLVWNWVNENYTNYGMILHAGTGTSNSNEKQFYSTNYATNTSLRPILEINYTTPPSIGNITSAADDSSATINWTTDDSTNSSINYGVNISLGTTALNSSMVVNHSIVLSNLSLLTIYYYNITSCNAYLCNTTGPYNFTTGNYNVTVVETVKDASGTELNTTMEIIDMDTNLTVYNDTKKTHSKSIPKKNYKIKIKPQNKKIIEITFENVSIQQNINHLVDINDINESGTSWDQIYSLNASDQINSTISVTINSAKSNALYKCTDWNWTTQTCYGSWTKYYDMVPGQSYTFSINSADPGFAEANITTHYLHNESSTQFPAYKIMNISTNDTGIVTSAALTLNALGTYCWNTNWTTTNFSTPVRVNGTWNFTVYSYCSGGQPEAYMFARIFRLNATGIFYITNTTNASTDICVDTTSPGTANTWSYVLASETNISVGERIGVQFCVNVTNAAAKDGYIQWEDTVLSNVQVPIAYWDDVPPNITLTSPANNSWSNSSTNIFRYNVTDAVSNISNCSLILNRIINQTNSSITKGAMLNFTISGMNSGNYNWSVNCTDTTANTGSSETWLLKVDLIAPQWSNVSKNETTVYWNSSLKFNSTWIDNTALGGYVFNINQTGNWSNSSFVSFSGTTNVSENVSLITANAGTNVTWYFWANDSAGNSNQTSLQSFVVQARPTSVAFSVNQTVYPQGRSPGAGYDIYIPFQARYVDNLIGQPVSGASCYVINDETADNVTLTYNASTGNYTGQVTDYMMYDVVTFNVSCSKTNYANAINSTSTSVWFLTYLQEWQNRSYGYYNNYSTTWMRKEPITNIIPATKVYTLNLTSGNNYVAAFYHYAAGVNGSFAKSYNMLNTKTLRMNMSLTNASCKVSLCMHIEDYYLNNLIEECGASQTILANTPTLVEQNITNNVTLDQNDYMSIQVHLNCSSNTTEQLTVYYNYSTEPANIEIHHAQPFELMTYVIDERQLDSGYYIGPNQTANANKLATIRFNNTQSIPIYLQYWYKAEVKPDYPDSVVPNKTYIYNSTGQLLASDNMSVGAPRNATIHADNQIMWITESIPGNTVINETLNHTYKNAIRDAENLISDTSSHKIWNITLHDIYVEGGPRVNTYNITVWTNYSMYGLNSTYWSFNVTKTQFGNTTDITNQITVENTTGRIIFPMTNLSDVTYVVTAKEKIPPSFLNSATQPFAGTIYNQTSNGSMMLQVLVDENSTVIANITWDAANQLVNLSFDSVEGPWFIYTGNFSNLIWPGRYNVTYTATDLVGNSNTTTTYFNVTDITAPNITNISPANGTLFNYSSTVNMSANVADAFYDSVQSVLAQITYPSGAKQNFTMSEIDNTQIFSYPFSNTTENGQYNFTIFANDTSGNMRNANGMFIVIGLNSIQLDKYYYALGQTVIINGTNWPSNKILTFNISYNNSVINSWNLTINQSFTETYSISSSATLGLYTIFIYDSTNMSINFTNSFAVDVAPVIANISVSPNLPNVSQTINITADVADDINVSSVLIYLDGSNSSMSYGSGNKYYNLFNSSTEGVYNFTIYANDSYGLQNSANGSFSVINPNVSVTVNASIDNENATGVNSTITIYYPNGTLAFNGTATTFNFNLSENSYRFEIRPHDPIYTNDFSLIVLENITIYQNTTKIIDISTINSSSLQHPFSNIFSFVPYVPFSTGTITINVSSNATALYKCSDWNFTSQTCLGNWTWFSSVTPGQLYNITINASDPGFALVIQDSGRSFDTYISEANPLTNYGLSNTLETRTNGGNQERILIIYNMSSLPSGIRIDSATQELYLYAASGATITPWSVYRLTNSWEETIATWESRDLVNNWITPGGDYVATPHDGIIIDVTPGWRIWNITQLVNEWYNGTYPNYGVIIFDGSGGNRERQFWSNEYAANTSLRPKLVVNYTDIQAPYWSNQSQNASSIPQGSNILLSAYWTDNINLSYAVLATNESGVWTNRSTIIMTGAANWSNFTWSNASVPMGTNVGWRIYANDTSGNINVTNISTFSISFTDLIPPSILLNFPSNGSNMSTTAINFNWTASDNLDTNVTCNLTIDGTVNASNITSLNNTPTNRSVSGFVDGNHSWNVTCWDHSNNTNTSQTRSFTIDTTPPSITIVSPANTTYNNRTVLVNISAPGASSIWYNWNGTNTTYTTPVNVTFAEGANTIIAYANDSVGNFNSTNVTFITDTIPPSVTIVSPANTTYNNRTVLVNISAPGASNIWYNWNGTDTTYTTPVNVTFNEGTNILYAYVNDSVGNLNFTNTTFITDTISPSITIISPANTTYNNRTVLVNISTSGAANIWYNWNGTNVTYTTPVNVTFAEGINTLYAYANDLVGNQNSTNVTFRSDTTSPVVHLVSPPNNTLTNQPGQTFSCNITNVAVANLTLYIWNSTGSIVTTNTILLSGSSNATSWNFNLPYDNAFRWNCLGYDQIGNYNWSQEGNFTITLNGTPPSVTIVSPANTTYNNRTVLVNISAPGAASIWYNWNGTNITYTTPVNVTFAEGTNILYAWANDTAGNMNSTNVTFTTDTIPPSITIMSPQNTTYNNRTISVSISAPGAANIWYNWNGTNVTYTTPANVTFNEGSNMLYAYANDSVGNLNATNVTFFIDSIPPNVSILSPSPANNSISGNGNIVFDSSETDNLGLRNASIYLNGILNQTSVVSGVSNATTFTYISIPDGVYNWFVRVYDAINYRDSETRVLIVNRSAVPIYNTSVFTGNTTNWSALPDLSNVCNGAAILDTTYGMVQWLNCVNAAGQNFNTNVNITYNNVTVIASGLNSSFNSSAMVSLKLLPWDAAPLVYRDGVLCNSTECANLTYTGGVAIFNVSHFTSYTTSGNSQMFIWDETDTGMPFANQTKYKDQQVKSFANYTKKIDDSPVTNASCTINFADSSNNAMTYNATTTFYEYNRSFSNAGNFSWNVTCNKTGFNTQTTNDTVIITPDTVPPIIRLMSPANQTFTNQLNQTFRCNISNIAVSNLTLYVWNSTNSIVTTNTTSLSGASNSTSWNYTLPYSDVFSWNCLGFDTSGNNNWSQEGNYTITLDATPPAVSFVSPTEIGGSYINRSYVQVNVTASDANLANMTIRLYNSSNSMVNSSLTNSSSNLFANFTGLADGFYYFNATAYDSAGNSNSTETINVTVDTIPPALIDNSPIAPGYYNITKTINITATHASLFNFSIYVNGSVVNSSTATSSATLTYGLSNDGNYSYLATATDAAGNTNSTAIVSSIIIDKTRPVISIVSPQNITYGNTTILVNISASDVNLNTVWYNWNGTNVVYTGPVNVTFNQSSNTLYAYANDSAGNVNYTNVTFFIYLEAPRIAIQSPVNTTKYNYTNISLNYTVSDPALDSCWYVLSNGSATVLVGCVNTTITAVEGVNNMTVYSNNSFGRINSSSVSFSIDITLPNITLQSPQNITYATTNISLNYTVYDLNGISACWYRFNGSNTALPNCSNSTFIAGQGNNTITVYTNDTYGNLNNITGLFSADTIPPVVNITSPLNNTQTTDPTPQIFFIITDNFFAQTNYTIFVDNVSNGQSGIALNNTVFSVNISPALNMTNHTIVIQGTDGVGNKANSTVLRIEVVPPTVYLQYPSDGSWINTSSVNFTFKVLDRIYATLNCSLFINGSLKATNLTVANNTNTTFYNISVAENSGQNWNVSCRNAGNGSGSDVFIFNVDITPPAVVDNSPIAAGYYNITKTINISIIDINVFNASIYVNGTVVNSSSGTNNSTLTYSLANEGNYSYYANATDIAINKNSTANVSGIIIDKTPPYVYGPTPSNGAFISGSSSQIFSTNVIDNNLNTSSVRVFYKRTGTSGFSNTSLSCTGTSPNYACSATVDLSTFGEVNISYYFEAYDLAGQYGSNGTSTSTLQVTIDRSYPTITNIAPANNSYSNNNTVTFFINVISNTLNTSSARLYHKLLAAVNYNTETMICSGSSPFFNCTFNLNMPLFYISGDTIRFYYTANDTLGRSANTNIFTFYYDKQKPTVSQIYPTSTLQGISTAFVANVSDDVAVSSCYFYFNNSNVSLMILNGTSAAINFTFSRPGNYNAFANCSDLAGNYNDTSITVVRINDTTPPQISDTYPFANSTVDSTSVNISANVTDPYYPSVDKVWVNVSSGISSNLLNMSYNVTPGRYGVLFNASSLGFYNMTIYANDTSGNVNNSGSISFVIDILPPSVALSFSANPITVGDTTTITCNASDDLGLQSVNITTPAGSVLANQTTYTATSAGTYSIYCNATDLAGRFTRVSADLTVNPTGGGGGGAGGGSSYMITPLQYSVNETTQVVSSFQQWTSINPDTPITLSVSNPRVAVTDVTFLIDRKCDNANLVTNEYLKPTQSSGDYMTYRMIEIVKNMCQANIKQSTIKFKILKSWFTENDLNASTISFSRLENNIWVDKPLRISGEDGSYYYYYADVEGFSFFSIRAKVLSCTCPSATDWSTCADGKQTRIDYLCGTETSFTCVSKVYSRDCETPTKTISASTAGTEKSSDLSEFRNEISPNTLFWLAAFLAALIISVATVLLLHKRGIMMVSTRKKTRTTYKDKVEGALLIFIVIFACIILLASKIFSEVLGFNIVRIDLLSTLLAVGGIAAAGFFLFMRAKIFGKSKKVKV